MTENELIDAAVAGDDYAFRKLIEPYLDRWRGRLLKMLRNPEDRDDALQVVLMRLHKYLKTFRKDSQFTTWSYELVGRVGLDFIEARKRRPATVAYSEQFIEQLLPLEPSALELLEAKRAEALIDAGLAKLSSGIQRTVKANNSSELTRPLTATERTHMFRFRKSLRASLAA